MKKIIYTIAFLLATGTLAHAQTPLKVTGADLADFTLLENEVLLYTRKEADGQYLYTEKRGDASSAKRAAVLNGGTVNALVGRSQAGDEYYVYQKKGRGQEVLSFYTYKDGVFEKSGERKLPRLKNHSHNLGLFLSADKNTLLISAELGRSYGYEDLYVSKWEINRWGKPRNLGRNINTRQVEFAPYTASDTLYFSRKEESGSYNYSASFSGEGVAGEPARLAPVVNTSGTYNAYYKKADEREMWISASADSKSLHTAYVLEKPEEAVVEEAVVEEAVADKPLEVVEAKAAAPAAVFYYDFNKVYLNLEGVSSLAKFITKQPEGSTIMIKGFSDGYGTPEVKEYVSRSRALLVQRHIEKYFPKKKFTFVLESEVRDERGKQSRKTEVYLP